MTTPHIPKNIGAALPDGLTVLDSDPGEFAVCRFRDVLIVAWPKRAAAASVARLKIASMEVNRSPRPVAASVHIVGEGAEIPSADARAGFMDLMKNHSRPARCMSVVLGGNGFWASALRSVVLGMRMVTQRSFALTFHSDTATSAHWLAKESQAFGGQPVDPEQLARAMDLVVQLARGV